MSTAANLVEAKSRRRGQECCPASAPTGFDSGRFVWRGSGPKAIAVDPKQISRILHSEQGHNTIFDMARAAIRAR